MFDRPAVGHKRGESKNLFVHGGSKIHGHQFKPTQFNLGRYQVAQVVRKQFPLSPAAATTVYSSQVDTQSQSVVNANTTSAIPRICHTVNSLLTDTSLRRTPP